MDSDAEDDAASRTDTPDSLQNIKYDSERHQYDPRVEIGAENYNTIRRLNGHPGAGLSISLSPGADALKTVNWIDLVIDC